MSKAPSERKLQRVERELMTLKGAQRRWRGRLTATRLKARSVAEETVEEMREWTVGEYAHNAVKRSRKVHQFAQSKSAPASGLK